MSAPGLRPSWLEVDLDAARANLGYVRGLVGPARKVFAVVKADGYGFGAVVLGRVFLEAGADALAVADANEGMRLRRSGITAAIVVYPSGLPEAVGEMVAHGLTPTVTHLEGARAVAAAAASAPSPGAGALVKVDVGLERLGVPADGAVKTIRAMLELPGFRLAGLCAHPHASPGGDPAYVDWQLGRFTAVVDELVAQGVEIPVRMLASTPLVLRFPHTYLNAVDPGRALYGVAFEGDGPRGAALRPALRALKSRLIEVKAPAPRARFAAEAPFPPTRFGVIPMGAADGLLHLHAGHVLVRGRVAPLIGGPNLEHTRIDLTSVPDATVGDEVVVIGRQGDAEITLAAVAAHQKLAPHTLATLIGPRIPRVY